MKSRAAKAVQGDAKATATILDLVERYLSSGTISFELNASEVDSLLVAYR